MIVDDHAVVREGLRNFLGMVDGIEVAGEAASGPDALALAEDARPRVVLIMSGIAGGTQNRPEELLTSREVEVLRCLGRGLSNKLIAEELFISEKTVKTHVGNLLAKLDLADRTQAALFAVKRGLT
jgi:DNA-binding NarL/FixJ family response regulator